MTPTEFPLLCNLTVSGDNDYPIDCNAPAVIRYRPRSDIYGPWRGRCAAHERSVSGKYAVVEPLQRAIPAADIEQLVADSEPQVDDMQRDPERVLNDLLRRLRMLAGLDASAYAKHFRQPMIIGGADKCLLTLPHSPELCGKSGAHR